MKAGGRCLARILPGIAMVFMGACQHKASPAYVEFLAPADPSAWNPLEELVFSPGLSGGLDSLSHTLWLTVRHTDAYPSTDLKLIVEMTRNDVPYPPDTLTLKLCDPDGRWLGKGTRGVFTISHPIESPFNGSGKYIVAIRPDSRAPVEGISAIGIIVYPEEDGKASTVSISGNSK